MKILKPNATVIQDTRRAKSNLLYSVKLRITFNREQRYYAIGLDLSIEDFQLMQNPSEIKLITNVKERRKLQDIKLKCDSLLAKVHDIVNDMKIFTFTNFENRFFNQKPSTGEFVYPYFQTIIDKLNNEGRVGTASNYSCSLKSLENFKSNLKFKDVNVEFLNSYEKWLLDEGKSISTVGIYLRPFRAILNSAISEGHISKEGSYPFGKGQYQIPSTRNIKKALTKEEIKLIYEYKGPQGTWWEKARDFFMFSYLSNGMNMKDILMLRKRDIDGNYFRFIRAKTKNTNKNNLKSISIFISPELRRIINKWATVGGKEDGYLFPFLEKGSSPQKLMADIQQFIKMVNKYMGFITKEVGIDKKVTTYFARHSFATILKRSGVSTELISESLGHSNIHTTTSYLDSFDDETKKDISEKLLSF